MQHLQGSNISREGERQAHVARRKRATAKLLPPLSSAPLPALHPALRSFTQPLPHWSSPHLLHHQGGISPTALPPLFAPSTPLPYPTYKQLHQRARHPVTGVSLQVLETALVL